MNPIESGIVCASPSERRSPPPGSDGVTAAVKENRFYLAINHTTLIFVSRQPKSDKNEAAAVRPVLPSTLAPPSSAIYFYTFLYVAYLVSIFLLSCRCSNNKSQVIQRERTIYPRSHFFPVTRRASAKRR